MIASTSERHFNALPSEVAGACYASCNPHRLSSSSISSLGNNNNRSPCNSNNNSSSTAHPSTSSFLDRSCPTLSITTVVSPTLALRRRPTSKRSLRSFHRMALRRRTINPSHSCHPHPLYQQPSSRSNITPPSFLLSPFKPSDSLACTHSSRPCSAHQAGLSPTNSRDDLTNRHPFQCLCSGSSTELQASVYVHPFTTFLDGAYSPSDLSTAPLSRSFKRSSDNSNDAHAFACRRHSDGEAVWTRVLHSKEKVIARLQSGSAIDLHYIPRRTTTSTWPPVQAMIHQGLTAAKRSSASLSEQDHCRGQEKSGYDQSLPSLQSNKQLSPMYSSFDSSSPYSQSSSRRISPIQRFSLPPLPTTKTLSSSLPEQRFGWSVEHHQDPSSSSKSSLPSSDMDICGLFQVRASRHLVSQLQQQLRLRTRSRRRVYGDDTMDQKLSCSPHLIPRRRVSALRKKQAALRLAQDSVQRLPQPSKSANQYLEQEQTQGSIPSGRSNGGLVIITTFSGSEGECEGGSTSSGSLTLSMAEHPIRMDQHVSHHHQQPMTDGSDKKDVMPRSPASSLSILFSKENELQGAASPRSPASSLSILFSKENELQGAASPRSPASSLSIPFSKENELQGAPSPRSPASSLSILFSKENEIQEEAVEPLETVEVKPRKFLDSSYQFPAREGAYGRDTFARPQRTQHGYHQSLPYNSIKRSSFTVQTSDFHASATFDTLSTATPVPDHDNDVSESGSAGQESDSNQQEADSTCKFPMGPPRLRRSGSCNNISHRSALSFSSSKKALLSLQERRLSKPEAKLLRLPDIRTSHSRHPSSTHSRQRSHVSPINHYESEALQEAAANLPLPSEQQDPSPLDSTLNLTFEGITIEPNPMDAGEIKRFVKRSHALQELLTTEESYVNDLDTLMHVHLRVLEARSWFPQSLQVKMERCVSGLLSLHRDLHYRLVELNMTSESCDRETLYMNLAEAFQIVDRDDLLYSTYCELRMRTIKEIDRSAGQTAIALLQRESKELMAQQGRPSTRADVKDFLIKPIQRICRYPLLLKEILRLTDEDDSEYQYVDQAFQLVKQKAQEIDETQREAERKLLTEQFLKKLPESSLPRKLVSGSQKDQSAFEYHGYGYQQGGVPSPGFPSDYGMASSQDGIVPAPFTRAFAGTLGSILLAGALEYVNTSEVPLRLRYYGCFLFDAMLVIVKAKKSNNYEPRQWLPLRLCELQETIQVDGYTRFGWRIVFDQFKIDFGACSAAEQQIWMGNLQERIHIAKAAYARLPREVALFENLVSSLPWRMNRNQASSLMSSRHLQICQVSPPPAAASSTMMTAMSSMVTGEPEKWNARGSVAALDAYISQDEASEAYGKWPYPASPPSVSLGEHGETRIGGMAGSGFQEKEVAEQQARSGVDSQMRPDSSFLLNPSTPVPRLMSEKHRSHSFDVTKVFTSSTGSIKPNQRSLVQSMFKDVSSENVWTTNITPQPSPQYASSLSRYSSASPFNYFQPTGTPPSPKMTVSAPIQIPGLHPDSAIPPANLSLGDEGSTGTVSLTSRLLRRRTSANAGHSLPDIISGFQERVGFEYERRRNSSSVGVSTTSFNLRKASEIAHQNNQQQLQRRSSLHDSVIVPGQNASYENEHVVLRPRLQKSEKKTPLRDPVSKLAATGNRFSRWSSGLGHFFDDSEAREVPPLPTQDDSAIHDTFHALSNAAELARSRRGNPERPVRRGTLPSRSLPTLLSATNLTTESMEASQPADVTVENVEKHWTSMVPNRGVGMNYGGSSDTSGRSRSNSSSDSSQCGPTHTPGEMSVSFAPMYPPHAHLQSPMHNERSGLGKGLLRRSSTNGSRSTARTARTAYSASSPLLAPYTISPRSTANHTRNNSRESLESNLSFLAGSTAVEHGSPPSMGLTPALSITNWTKETSHAQYERPGPQAYPRPMEVVSGPNKGANMWPQPQQQQEHQQHQQQQGREQDSSVDSLPAGYPPERRKSLTILQNISSATQKFKTLIRTPSRRRTVMHLSPTTVDHHEVPFGEATGETEMIPEEQQE